MILNLKIGDGVYSSPVGPGTITGVTDAGYPQVNYIAVARLIHKTDKGELVKFDPHGSYERSENEISNEIAQFSS